jgi:hypothetical protein
MGGNMGAMQNAREGEDLQRVVDHLQAQVRQQADTINELKHYMEFMATKQELQTFHSQVAEAAAREAQNVVQVLEEPRANAEQAAQARQPEPAPVPRYVPPTGNRPMPS